MSFICLFIFFGASVFGACFSNVVYMFYNNNNNNNNNNNSEAIGPISKHWPDSRKAANDTLLVC